MFFALTQAVKISGQLYCGYSHTLAIKFDSTLWAWGNNSKGQLGNGSTGLTWLPIKIVGMAGMIDVAAGFEHTEALKSDGTVWSWGRNSEGELDDETTTQRVNSSQVNGLSNIIKVGTDIITRWPLKMIVRFGLGVKISLVNLETGLPLIAQGRQK